MDIQSETIKYTAYLAVLTAAIAIEHMAFRTPQWQQRELARRFIGSATVLVLYLVFVVLDGAADFLTWLGIVGGFAISAGVKVAFQWYDATRRRPLVGKLHDNTGED